MVGRSQKSGVAQQDGWRPACGPGRAWAFRVSAPAFCSAAKRRDRDETRITCDSGIKPFRRGKRRASFSRPVRGNQPFCQQAEGVGVEAAMGRERARLLQRQFHQTFGFDDIAALVGGVRPEQMQLRLQQRPMATPTLRRRKIRSRRPAHRAPRTALKRIKAGAAQICGERPDPKLLALNLAYAACRSDIMSRNVAAFNAAMLTALYSGKAGAMTTASR